MCRRLTIDLQWDSDHEDEDAGDVFEHETGYDTLRPDFEAELRNFLENRFSGGISFRVTELPTE